ncbi:MAG: hypothetical protein ACXVQV_02000 [Actinomycetota bacterium]
MAMPIAPVRKTSPIGYPLTPVTGVGGVLPMSSRGFVFVVFVGEGSWDGVVVADGETVVVGVGETTALSVGDAEGVTVTAKVGDVLGVAVSVVLPLFTKMVMTPATKMAPISTASSL